MTKIHELRTPVSESDIRKLRVGDVVYLSGTIFTARDRAHLRILEEGSPVDIGGGVIFHCGPIVKKVGGKWKVVAMSPTTSSRMNSVAPEFIRRYKITAIIGKGGMDKNVARAMKGKAVYLSMTGGCAALGAKAVKKVKDVVWSDLGMAEAIWVIDVERLGPLIVTIDSHGKSMYETVNRKVDRNLKKVLSGF